MRRDFFYEHYSQYLNCRVKSAYELLLFSGCYINPYLLSLMSQNTNAYLSMINYKGISVPVFSSLHPGQEVNILDCLEIPYIRKSVKCATDIVDLVENDIPVIISYDADSLSRGVKNHNFGLISATVLWNLDTSNFVSTRKDCETFIRYNKDSVISAMTVETQPVSANGNIVYIDSNSMRDKIISIDYICEKIRENLLITQKNAALKLSRKNNEYNCIEGTLAFEEMRIRLMKLNQIIGMQNSDDVASRMFLLSNTIILKVIEKNGFGFDSFQNCFWMGYVEYIELTGKSVKKELIELSELISKKWKEMYELLKENKKYSVERAKMSEFFMLIIQLFADIENLECTLLSNIEV